MRSEALLWATAILATGCATGGIASSGRFTPVADHHQHLFSPAIVALLGDSTVTPLGTDVGVEGLLYGSDGAVGRNLRPRESWATFRSLALTDDEIARIADNLAPYFK